MIAGILSMLVQVYVWILLVYVAISWIPALSPGWEPKGALVRPVRLIRALVDPPVDFLRKWFSPAHIGSFSFDVAFLLWFLVVIVVQRAIGFLPI